VVFQTGALANGGVESITQVLTRLSRIEAIVVTQRETAATARWRAAGFEVQVWDLPDGAAKPQRAAAAALANLRLLRLVRAAGAKVVHCNDIVALLHAAAGARLAGARVVHNIRDVKAEGRRYDLRWKVLSRVATMNLCLSRDMSERLGARLGSFMKPRLSHVYSAADSPALLSAGERAALRAKLGIGTNELAIGCVAAFAPKKRQLELIREVLPPLRRRVPGARVHFLGDYEPERNPYAAGCARAVAELDVGPVVAMHGFRTDLADWYRALDLVVVASEREGLARCMIESLAAGTPVVSFAVASAREILEAHDCGVVVAHGDHAALLEAIAELAAQPEERARLGARGRAVAADLFAPARVVLAHEDLYLRLARE
jgi:glycosyltransferase involved in cell wall biosynthesis